MWKEKQSEGPQQRYVGQEGGDLGEGSRGRKWDKPEGEGLSFVHSFTGESPSLVSPHFPDGETEARREGTPSRAGVANLADLTDHCGPRTTG